MTLLSQTDAHKTWWPLFNKLHDLHLKENIKKINEPHCGQKLI